MRQNTVRIIKNDWKKICLGIFIIQLVYIVEKCLVKVKRNVSLFGRHFIVKRVHLNNSVGKEVI